MVSRLEDREASMVPSVTGQALAQARQALDGFTVNVVAFGAKGDPVSAQWPPAGDPRPSDGQVVVWTGEPPVVKVPRQSQQKGGTIAVAAPPPGSGVIDPEYVAKDGTAPKPAAGAAPGGVTPGLENMVPPPHPPRANIRTLPAAKPGTKLAGRASWYGPGFAGRQTACGGTFDPAALTLASRELRCGTVVTVTGASGRSVTATATDWGPAEWTGRRFDLSQGTMAAVNGLGAGVIDVTVTVN